MHARVRDPREGGEKGSIRQQKNLLHQVVEPLVVQRLRPARLLMRLDRSNKTLHYRQSLVSVQRQIRLNRKRRQQRSRLQAEKAKQKHKRR